MKKKVLLKNSHLFFILFKFKLTHGSIASSFIYSRKFINLKQNLVVIHQCISVRWVIKLSYWFQNIKSKKINIFI